MVRKKVKRICGSTFLGPKFSWSKIYFVDVVEEGKQNQPLVLTLNAGFWTSLNNKPSLSSGCCDDFHNTHETRMKHQWSLLYSLLKMKRLSNTPETLTPLKTLLKHFYSTLFISLGRDQAEAELFCMQILKEAREKIFYLFQLSSERIISSMSFLSTE